MSTALVNGDKLLYFKNKIQEVIDNESKVRDAADDELKSDLAAQIEKEAKDIADELAAREAGDLAEANARRQAVDEERDLRIKAVSEEATARELNDNAEANAREAADQLLTQLINRLYIVGEVKAYLGGAVPDGFLLCDGAMYAVEDFPDLYGVIGRTYTSDDITEDYFQVPDMVTKYTMLQGSTVAGRFVEQSVPDVYGELTDIVTLGHTDHARHGAITKGSEATLDENDNPVHVEEMDIYLAGGNDVKLHTTNLMFRASDCAPAGYSAYSTKPSDVPLPDANYIGKVQPDAITCLYIIKY